MSSKFQFLLYNSIIAKNYSHSPLPIQTEFDSRFTIKMTFYIYQIFKPGMKNAIKMRGKE